jgi:hypothetical protein
MARRVSSTAHSQDYAAAARACEQGSCASCGEPIRSLDDGVGHFRQFTSNPQGPGAWVPLHFAKSCQVSGFYWIALRRFTRGSYQGLTPRDSWRHHFLESKSQIPDMANTFDQIADLVERLAQSRTPTA